MRRHRCNPYGNAFTYQKTPLLRESGAARMAQPGSSVASRAAFATKHLWVTPFDPAERFPAGDYPNQHTGDGLTKWTQADRSLENTDVVLWHVFGPTHVPRTEDWPIMPVDYSGFMLKPNGFLDRNPALDLPDGAAKHHGTSAMEAGSDGGSCCH